MIPDTQPLAQWTETITGLSLQAGYFVETAPDVFEATTSRDMATHVWDVVGGSLVLVPINTAASPGTMLLRGETFFVYEV